jgi:DNA repair exonuclease SbcCD ATPase subunit
MKTESFTIKPNTGENHDELRALREKYHENRAEKNLTPMGYLGYLLNSANSGETDSLQDTINDLNARLQVFEAENKRLQADLDAAKNHIQGNSENLGNRIQELEQALDEKTAALESLQQESAGKIEIKFPEFICKPSTAIAEAVAKSRDRFYAAGFTTNKDHAVYPNEFATYAMRYLLLNEFQKRV